MASALPAASVLAAAILAALLFAVNPATAQDPMSMTPEEIYFGQPPLAEREIPVALEIAEPLADGEVSESKYRSLSDRYGLTFHRILYIQTKCFLAASAHAAGRPLTDQEILMLAGTPLALPTPEEEAVIRPYLDELVASLKK
jgi:hypothetical protein